MTRARHYPLHLILALFCAIFTGSCERTEHYSGKAGSIEAGTTRIRYYIDNGTTGEAQRVLLVMGKSVSSGMSEGMVHWSRSFGGDSRECRVLPEDRVWIVWEDDSVAPLAVAPVDVAGMIDEWSDGDLVPEALASLIANGVGVGPCILLRRSW